VTVANAGVVDTGDADCLQADGKDLGPVSSDHSCKVWTSYTGGDDEIVGWCPSFVGDLVSNQS
jgi:hypothetical protein